MRIQYYSIDWIMNIGIVVFFLVFLMIFIILVIHVISRFRKQEKRNFAPDLTVIIPAYNEEKLIGRTIRNVLDCNYDSRKLEIICVDDGSTDRTAEIARSLAVKHKNIKLINGDHKGKSAALDLGVKSSSNEFIMSVDADTVIGREFITEIIAPFADEKVGAANGMAFISKPKGIIEHFQNIEYYFNNLIRNSFSKVFDNGIWFYGAAACFRKKALEKAGEFSKEVLTEDMDISLRIFEQGYKVITVENAYYHTRAEHNIAGLFKQRMRWFFGGLQCSVKHKKLLKRKSFAVKYLFFNQFFWAGFSLIAIPLVAYEVFYWMPQGNAEIFWYIFRWFSLAGPVYVLYKIPVWGLSLLSIFGVSAGIITTILILSSLRLFKGRLTIIRAAVIFFYFPYTLLLNAILTLAILRYSFGKKRHFVK